MNIKKSNLMKNNEIEIHFLGQAGFIISNNDFSVGIDLYLSHCVERIYGFKRLTPIIVDPKEVYCDLIIATHHHEDHFDVDSMQDLVKEKTSFLGAIDCVDHIKRIPQIPYEKCNFLKPGDKFENKHIEILAVDCDHGESAPDAIGLIINIGGKRLYFTGDTGLRLDYAEKIKKIGQIDVMVLPINGEFGNMNSSDAAKLVEVINPKIVIPSHFWTFVEHVGNPNEFLKKCNEINPNTSSIKFMRLGEKIYV